MKKVITKGLTTITGPSRGGKSLWAERLVQNQDNVIYIATLEINNEDVDLEERIKIHKSRRPKIWKTVEGRIDLVSIINNTDSKNYLIIDSLGGFIAANLHLSKNDWIVLSNNLMNSINNYKGSIIIVIEEVGWGLISQYKIGNIFRDRIGILSQQLESISINSWLVLQGRAIDLNKFSIRI